MKTFRPILSVLLVLCFVFSMTPAIASADDIEIAGTRGVNSTIIIDDDAAGGYEGDYVVIYNPSTSSSTSYSTGTMTGLIETSVNASILPGSEGRRGVDPERPFYKIDVDAQLKEQAESEEPGPEPIPTRASYNVGDTKSFRIYASYSPTGNSSVSFKCLYVGAHCYIWTPVSSSSNTYPLDEIDSSFAKLAADEFDSKFDLMQSSFGNHTNGSSGDGKLHMLYYNINDGWQPGQGYVAGFFYQVDITNNGLPILNIDTYPGVYYKNSSGTEYKRMDDTYNTMVHEYQHLINYSNTSGMSSWLNECFSAAAEEICYPGSSVVSRIQSWENYYYSDNNDWLDPPAEFEYQSDFQLHNGYSLYTWNNNLDDILALYSQVSFFAQYLFTRFGNTIYKQISSKYSSSETSAITSATGVSCSDLARDFRVAVTANAAQDQYNGIYGFKVQDGYDPSNYHNVQSPWDLLSPIIFTGTSCSIKGGGAITVKPVNGVYNPPSGANSNLKYIGIKLSTEPVHQHNMTHFAAVAPTCVDPGNIEYWYCADCGKYFSDEAGNNEISLADTVLPAAGHNYSNWTSNNDGTHSHYCTVCSQTETENCTYQDVVTAPTATEQGYTTHTCTVCGYSFVDSYTDPLGNDYLVSFSVPTGVPAVAAMTCHENGSITLPTAGAPVGYTFLGWVLDDYNNVLTLPDPILTGSYTATANVTLKALYSKTETSGAGYQLLTDEPTDWNGDYVITAGSSADDMIALRGLNGSKKYETKTAGGAVAFADAGMSLDNGTLTGVNSAYVFRITDNGGQYTISNAATGYYLGSKGSCLYSLKSFSANYCSWTLSVNSGVVDAVNPSSRSFTHLALSTSGYFMVSRNAGSEICFWKMSDSGTTTTVYTTVID